MSVEIIVNADDLGISESVNRAILSGMEQHAITSATCLSNGPAIKDAVLRLRDYPHCSFGAHLNVIQFKPVSEASYRTLSSLLDEGGFFRGDAIRNVRITPRLLEGVYHEWCAQIDNLNQMGVQPSHLDSHEHVHTIPLMLPVMAALRKRYRIDKVRISRNLYDPAAPCSALLLSKKRLYNWSLRAVGFKSAETFTDLETFVKVCAHQRPFGRLIELMVHPGAPGKERESSLLASRWLETMSYPARLVNYNSL